jgi:hypothetical protein
MISFKRQTRYSWPTIKQSHKLTANKQKLSDGGEFLYTAWFS